MIGHRPDESIQDPRTLVHPWSTNTSVTPHGH